MSLQMGSDGLPVSNLPVKNPGLPGIFDTFKAGGKSQPDPRALPGEQADSRAAATRQSPSILDKSFQTANFDAGTSEDSDARDPGVFSPMDNGNALGQGSLGIIGAAKVIPTQGSVVNLSLPKVFMIGNLDGSNIAPSNAPAPVSK